MFDHRFLNATFALMACLLGISAQGSEKAQARMPWHVPPIAHIGGFVVGVDTIEMMEKHLGKTKGNIGQQPNSSHSWSLRRTHLQLWADGSEYKATGLVINQFELSGDHNGQGLSHHTVRRTRGFLGLILPGMSRQTVIRLTRHRLPPPEIDHGDMIWTMAGKALIRRAEHGYPEQDTASWTAKLHFENNVLSWIDVESDQ